ncbi:MAG: hypothetical protein ACJ796_21830 [Gemmatimonadaceae bacterium]
MRMTSLAVLSAVGAAACVRGGPRVEPAPAASSVMQSGDRENGARLQASANANSQSDFEYRRMHSSAGRFITAVVLSANGDRSLDDLLRARLVGFESGTGRPSRPNGECGLDVYVNGLRSVDAFDGIRPRDLIGVEYYEAGSAPVKYRRAFSTCPVLLLWLKA